MKRKNRAMIVIAIVIIIASQHHTKVHKAIPPAPSSPIVLPVKVQEPKDFDLVPRVVMFL